MTYEHLMRSRARFKQAALALALMSLLAGTGAAYYQAKAAKLEGANRDLATSFVTNCAAQSLGEMAWLTFGPDDAMVCLKFRTPPTRDQWLRYLHKTPANGKVRS